MKAQATLEAMILFATTIIMIMIITQSLLSSYVAFEKRSSELVSRAALEKDLVAFSINCNSDINNLPSPVLAPSGNYKLKASYWFVTLVMNQSSGYNDEMNISAVTTGCRIATKSYI